MCIRRVKARKKFTNNFLKLTKQPRARIKLKFKGACAVKIEMYPKRLRFYVTINWNGQVYHLNLMIACKAKGKANHFIAPILFHRLPSQISSIHLHQVFDMSSFKYKFLKLISRGRIVSFLKLLDCIIHMGEKEIEDE